MSQLSFPHTYIDSRLKFQLLFLSPAPPFPFTETSTNAQLTSLLFSSRNGKEFTFDRATEYTCAYTPATLSAQQNAFYSGMFQAAKYAHQQGSAFSNEATFRFGYVSLVKDG